MASGRRFAHVRRSSLCTAAMNIFINLSSNHITPKFENFYIIAYQLIYVKQFTYQNWVKWVEPIRVHPYSKGCGVIWHVLCVLMGMFSLSIGLETCLLVQSSSKNSLIRQGASRVFYFSWHCIATNICLEILQLTASFLWATIAC